MDYILQVVSNEKGSTGSKKKQWQIPDTFILIFLVGVFATVLTYLIPAGSFTQQEISYVVDGVEKTRSVVDPESFKVALNEQGEPV